MTTSNYITPTVLKVLILVVGLLLCTTLSSTTSNDNTWAWFRTANVRDGNDAGFNVAVANDRVYFVGRFGGHEKYFTGYGEGEYTVQTSSENDKGDGFMAIYNLQGQLLHVIRGGSNNTGPLSTTTHSADSLDSVQADSNGDIYVVGRSTCEGTVCNFFVGNYSEVIEPDTKRLFVAKFTADGDTIWVQTIPVSSSQEASYRVAVTGGRVIVLGLIECTATVIVGSETLNCLGSGVGANDFLLVAISGAGGSIEWAQVFGSDTYEYFGYLAAYDDYILVSGGTTAQNIKTEEKTFSLNSGYKQFVLIFDINGHTIGMKAWEGSASGSLNFPAAIAVAGDAIYLTGAAKNSLVAGSCTINATNGDDAYLIKFPRPMLEESECLWIKHISRNGNEYGRGVAVGPDAVYFSGYAENIFQNNNNTKGLFIQKYSFSGELLWDEPFPFASTSPVFKVQKLEYSSYSLFLGTTFDTTRGIQLAKLEMPLPSWTVTLEVEHGGDCDDFKFKALVEPSNISINKVEWIIGERVINVTDTLELTIPAIWSGDIPVGNSHLVAVVHTTLYGRSNTAKGEALVQKRECTKICLQSSPGCRYLVSFENIEPNRPSNVNRMNSHVITAVASTHGHLSSIPSLSYSWSYKIISSIGSLIRNPDKVNAIVTSPSGSSFLEVRPQSSRGIEPSVRFNITLELTAGASHLAVSFQMVTSAANPISTPTTNALRIVPTVGLSLKDNFVLDSTGWKGEFAYTFSYLDQSSQEYVPLNAEESQNLISTTLPAGELPNYNLFIRVTVLDKQSGNIGHADSAIVVKPYIQKGVLTQKTEEAIVSGNYTTALSIASQIRSATKDQTNKNKEELQQVVSDLLDYTLSNIVQTESETANPVVVEQQVLVVDMLTKNSDVVSNVNKKVALNAVKSIISLAKSNVTEAIVNKATIQRIANVISNVANRGFSDEGVANETVATANNLARFVLEKQVMSDSATTLLAQNFELSVKRDSAAALAQNPIRASNSSANGFQISDQFGSDVNSDAVSFTLLVFPENPYQRTKNGTEVKVSSPIVELTFQYDNGTNIPVSDLKNPILIEFDRRKAKAQGACPEATFDCKYWSEDERIWKSDGCYWVNNTATNRIVCACNHTTSFSAFILEKGDSCVSQAGIKITGIVFNSLYLVICIPILIGLFLVRDVQPLRSRFIAPYIGIIAIIVDSVLQGWIRNSLSLAGKTDASDGFSFVIMLTTNPLTVVALFIFLWQQVRFILMQNIYHLMATAGGTLQKGIVRLCRLITSKLLFVVISSTVGIFVMAYFAILVGLAAHYSNISTKDRDKMVTVQAVSFAVMMIILSIAILITLLVDIILSFRRSAASKRNMVDNTGTSTEVMQIQKAKGLAVITKHFTDDPLLFRVEACLIIIAILVIMILYSIGIATVVKKSKPHSAIMVARTIIEIIEMLIKIIAFGGFVLLASIRNYWLKKYSIFSRINNEEEKVNPHDQRILDILRQDDGYNMVYTYCQREFSLENLLLWKDLEELRTQNLVMSPTERKAVLSRINELYMMSNSERQLNISNQARKVFVKVAELESPTVAEAEEAFAKLYGVCIMNIADTFTRLSASDLYRKYLDSKAIQVELNDDFTDGSK